MAQINLRFKSTDHHDFTFMTKVLDEYTSFIKFYCREWTEGTFGKVDPDTVEQDIGNLWRGLYKLEKTFSENPTAKSIAEKV